MNTEEKGRYMMERQSIESFETINCKLWLMAARRYSTLSEWASLFGAFGGKLNSLQACIVAKWLSLATVAAQFIFFFCLGLRGALLDQASV